LYITDVESVREYRIRKAGAKGARVRHLLHKGVGATRLQLRLFTIDVDGYTPVEKHEHEHEVFIMRGQVLVRGRQQEAIVKAGKVLFIPSNEEHQFKNTGNEPAEFLCTKETF